MPTAHSSPGGQQGPHSTLEARWAPKAVLGPGPNLLIEGLGCFPFKQPEMAQSHHRWEAEARIDLGAEVEALSLRGWRSPRCKLATLPRWGGARRPPH